MIGNTHIDINPDLGETPYIIHSSDCQTALKTLCDVCLVDRIFAIQSECEREEIQRFLANDPPRRERIWSMVFAEVDRIRKERFESRQLDIALRLLDEAEVKQ